ncbi:rRNA pseudouridine synthase [Patescibacteria group bacterium]|nr:rRNA pseudouridine synthase [Patescibacteria group bacterium]MBU1016319.1 rRNA pseudouridine synthase [Patescibacteria group bacterium]MBU1685022.1 rRNA pseudouridine synthase [Patescibacteria group bacterium]MBU1938830.1 rRNA pseudouridine synthase [Patescibacteria group bacterium]
MTFVRLNKYLSEQGIASRREADRLIAAGMVKVNGKTVTEMGIKVDPETDKVEVDEVRVKEDRRLVYIVLNKPKGYVCSMKPTREDPDIVTDLIDVGERVYPVGRLDKETTGLLLLTNDGTLVNRIIHPSAESEKEYEVTFYVQIPEGVLDRLRAGVKLAGESTLPTRVKKVGPAKIRIVLREGKNRQIRRVCQKVGFPVKTLKRTRIKNLHLGDLPLGRWRHLTEGEVSALKS